MLLWIPLVAGAILLICFWMYSEAEFSTKIILTGLCVGFAGGCFIPEYGMLFAVALTTLDGVLWWMTFGQAMP